MNTNSNDFNWDNLTKTGGSIYTAEERAKMEAMYDGTLSTIVEHEVVKGTVAAITSKEVIVNIGFKSDGMVPLSEFRDIADLKIGDTVDVYIEAQEDKNGQLLLSHKRAKALKSWDRINEAFEKDEIIQGYVKCRTKGGLIVDIFGTEAFLPGSQIDVKPIRDYDVFVSKTMEFKVVKINNEFKNVVVSHKVLIEEEIENQKSEIISKLEKGQVLEGTVKNITSYGVFMDLGGVDGLLHITDISWGRINHPTEVLQLDQKLNVVILDFDDDKKRIALGLKQLTSHPWDSLSSELKVGDTVKGKVVVLADYGAFIEIAQGVEGLIHVSEMSWSQHLRSPHDFLKVGDEVEAVVITLDRDERKMSLGIKQLKADPWVGIVGKYPVGSKHKATVRNFTNFGLFVELEEGIDGLVHISDLSWSKKIKHPNEFAKVGDVMEVVVLEVDAENRRLSLGHKQIEDNPWDVFESIFKLDSIHQGTVLKVADKGAVIGLPYGVEGFVPSKHMVKIDGSTLKGEEIADFKVIEFSKDNKKIIVSHARIHEEAAAEKKQEASNEKKKEGKSTDDAVKKIKGSIEKSTLGDIEALSSLRTDLESAEKATAAKKAAKAKKAETEEEVVEESVAPKKAAAPKAKKVTAKKEDKE